jgi:hypothetical protein
MPILHLPCHLSSKPGSHTVRPPCALRPNPSFKPTRYGRQRKPGPRHMVHHRVPGLRRLPPRAA